MMQRPGAFPRLSGTRYPSKQRVDGTFEDSFALRALRSRELLVVLVGVGIALRVAQYAANRSLWIDEAWVALNVIERPLSGLTSQLSFNQAAPIGFLLVERIVAKLLGFSEYALRLFPLISGLVSIPAFVWLARRILSAAAAPFAILLFVVADGLIYYASEVKPYETDVAVAVCLLAVGVFLAEDTERPTHTLLLVAAGGLILVLFSFPAVFVVAAVAGTLGARLLFDRRRPLRSPASLPALLWVSAAAAILVVGSADIRHVQQSFAAHSGRFLGVTGSPSPFHALNVMGTEIAAAIGLPQGWPFNQIEKLALLCVVAGAVALLRRNRAALSMLVVPFALVFGASEEHLYPIVQRAELFLVPPAVLLIAEGVLQIVRWVPARGRTMTALLLSVIVGAGPVALAGQHLVHSRTHEEIKPVLEFVRDHWRPGDTLYVHYGAQYALLYYEECRCLQLSKPHATQDLWPLRPLRGENGQFGQAAAPLAPDVILGRYFGLNADQYVNDLKRIRGRRRVWFLYSHVNDEGDLKIVQQSLLRYMGSLGRRIEGIDRPGAHAYLYRMRP